MVVGVGQSKRSPMGKSPTNNVDMTKPELVGAFKHGDRRRTVHTGFGHHTGIYWDGGLVCSLPKRWYDDTT